MKPITQTAQACADILDEINWIRADLGVPTSEQVTIVRNGRGDTLNPNIVARWAKNGIYLNKAFFHKRLK